MRLLSVFVVLLFAGTAYGSSATFFQPSKSEPEQFLPLGKGSWKVHRDRVRITIPVDPDDRWPGVIIRPEPGKHFDLSGYQVLAVDVRNLNRFPAVLQLEVVNLVPGSNTQFRHVVPGGIALNVGETATLRMRYGRIIKPGIDWAPGGLFVNFDGFDDPQFNLEVDKVDQLRFFVKDGEVEQKFELSNFRLEEPFTGLSPALESKETFYPCIDQFGQYKHAQWPGKMHSDAEFAQRLADEERDLAAHPGNADRTEFGGWSAGPSYPATGNFYPAKYKGKWYLVDPSGKLFWSFGINSLGVWVETGLALRENYFEKLPERDNLNSACFRTAYPGLRYYAEKNVKVTPTFNFYENNLIRKFGGDRWLIHLERTPRRLKSWGFNTIGNWSPVELFGKSKLPYVISVDSSVASISGDKGWWRNFYEIFDPEFENSLAENLRQLKEHLSDPYCIGFFVSNELSWGDDAGLVRGVLRSPATQPSKIAFGKRLMRKYKQIERLNAAWGGNYRSWDDFLARTELPDEKRAWKDLVDFNTEMIERYFSLVRDTLKREAPGKLYLGCRFPNDYNENVVRIAARYVDVLSFNLYKYSVANFRPPRGVDKPIIIGEWHFGTTNHGPASPGLCPTSSQTERARAFDRYIKSALWNPYVIGCHYFEYIDQPTAGRPLDSENMQIGFVDITDTPYAEMVDAARKASAELYECRSGEKR